MRLRKPYHAVIAAMLLVAQAASASPTHPQVVVAVTPITPYVVAILGNAGEAQALLRPDQDAHHATLSPSQIAAIEQADILVIPDLSMSPLITELTAKRPKLKVIELSKLAGADPQPYSDDNAWLAAKKPQAEKKDETKTKPSNPLFPKRLAGFNEETAAPKAAPKVIPDPHFWLDPERMAAIAPALADQLGTVNLAEKATYETNAREVARHLRIDVMPNLQQLLSTRHTVTIAEKEALPFIVSHAAYQYFLDRFKLPNPGELASRPDEYLGAATIVAIMETAKTTRIRCLLAETKTSMVEEVARLSGAKIILLSPDQRIGDRPIPPLDWIKDDYDRMLYDTAKVFGSCL